MKKHLLLIPVILALSGFAGWKIMTSEPAREFGQGEHSEGGKHEEHDKEGHGGHEEHGKEGHVELTPEKRKNANISVEKAGTAKIRTSLSVYGKVMANEDAMAHVMPRFPGIVTSVKKRLGDPVEKGEVLAQVESNESLKVYDIVSELTGTVIHKDVTLGEFVKDEKAIFTIADLSSVWVDMSIYRQDFGLLKTGQPLAIETGNGDSSASKPLQAEISYISPFGAEGTQTMLARAVVPNIAGTLRPGLFVTGEITTGQIDAKVAVRRAAVQTLKEKTVVFVEEGDAFEAREVELGAKDVDFVEVLSGLNAGDGYVAVNSFILKAEIGKEEAEHED